MNVYCQGANKQTQVAIMKYGMVCDGMWWYGLVWFGMAYASEHEHTDENCMSTFKRKIRCAWKIIVSIVFGCGFCCSSFIWFF